MISFNCDPALLDVCMNILTTNNCAASPELVDACDVFLLKALGRKNEKSPLAALSTEPSLQPTTVNDDRLTALEKRVAADYENQGNTNARYHERLSRLEDKVEANWKSNLEGWERLKQQIENFKSANLRISHPEPEYATAAESDGWTDYPDGPGRYLVRAKGNDSSGSEVIVENSRGWLEFRSKGTLSYASCDTAALDFGRQWKKLPDEPNVVEGDGHTFPTGKITTCNEQSAPRSTQTTRRSIMLDIGPTTCLLVWEETLREIQSHVLQLQRNALDDTETQVIDALLSKAIKECR